MRVLFLSQPHPDYLADMLYHGLVTLLGEENVDCYPPKANYFGDDRFIHDINSQLLFRFSPRGALEEKPRWDRYDLVIGDVTWTLLHETDEEREKLYIEASENSVFFLIDGNDHHNVLNNYKNRCHKYLKREYLLAKHTELPNVVPFPFAWIPEPLVPPWRSRDHGLSFVATETSVLRVDMNRYLGSFPFPDVVTAFGTRGDWPMRREEYLRVLLMSYASVSLPGVGYDCYRFYEILASGACLISLKLPLVMPNAFENWKNAIFIDGIFDLAQIIDWVLTDRQAVNDLGYEGFHHLRRYHTSRQRAETVVALWEELC